MDHRDPTARWTTPTGIFVIVAGLIGAYYLLTEHLTHVSQAVPYVFLLACPLMHLFHGHGHGGGRHGQGERPPGETERR
jgi:hypothetical protein